MTAIIQLTRGIDEEVSDVRLTRAKDGSSGTATFFFKEPKKIYLIIAIIFSYYGLIFYLLKKK
jgi:photosystem II reaction center protein Psb28